MSHSELLGIIVFSSTLQCEQKTYFIFHPNRQGPVWAALLPAQDAESRLKEHSHATSQPLVCRVSASSWSKHKLWHAVWAAVSQHPSTNCCMTAGQTKQRGEALCPQHNQLQRAETCCFFLYFTSLWLMLLPLWTWLLPVQDFCLTLYLKRASIMHHEHTYNAFYSAYSAV